MAHQCQGGPSKAKPKHSHAVLHPSDASTHLPLSVYAEPIYQRLCQK